MPPNEAFNIIWDSISFCATDFVHGVQPLLNPITINGVASDVQIAGQGTVRWVVTATDGSPKTIEVNAFYAPTTQMRLLSPQSYLQQLGHGSPHGAFSNESLTFWWPDGSSHTAPFSPNNNLPLSPATNEKAMTHHISAFSACVTADVNQNLSEAQKELLRWHFRLGHKSFTDIQALLKTGALASTEGAKQLHRNASVCKIPSCASCSFGKQTRLSSPGRHTVPDDTAGNLTKGDLLPGQRVSVDHFKGGVKGRLYESKGKTHPDQMLSGSCIFVDHASKYIHIAHQVSLDAVSTLAAKHSFEAITRDVGVSIQSYHSDNGVFSSHAYAQDLLANSQTQRFSGVGAHHQNGVAERSIRTITDMARTMLLHASTRWPEVADPTLWPMAIDYAVYIHNHIPSATTGLSPADILSGSKWPTQKCHTLHVWGAPTYVLATALQDVNPYPRWSTRSRRAVFLGLSNSHASSCPLVLNLASQFISPQFHCVFDDWFSTVVADRSEDDPIWQNFLEHSKYRCFFDDYQPPALGPDWNDPPSSPSPEPPTPPTNDNTVPSPTVSLPSPPTPPRSHRTIGFADDAMSKSREPLLQSRESPQRNPLSSPREPTPSVPTAAPDRRTSTRTNAGRRGPSYHDEFNFHAFAAAQRDPDILTFDQAMNSPESDDWRAAMDREIQSLVNHGTWAVVTQATATAADQRILPGTWTLRRKRRADGSVSKLKARWCVRGDLQEPVDNTYAPVVQWSTIRLLLYFSLFFGLITQSIDFSNAFVQAELKEDIFVHLPRGFASVNYIPVCLKLQKSLHGISQAPRLWFEHLKAKLLARGFVQSALDPCLFYRDDIVLLVYVDDVIIASRSQEAITRLIADLRTDSELTDEGPLSAILGIKVDRDEANSTFTLTQPGLTDKIIEAVGLTDSNSRWTPTEAESLGSDTDGPPVTETWNYRSIVGMLLYLSNNSRPDIAFAVHQCARFSHAHRQSHAVAVKAIVRYLIKTRDKGLILSPTGDLAIDCYVDADFAGLWHKENDQDPLCVKSRTGFVITIGGCPLQWTSKLQTEIALSTMEAEYIALSHAMRELLPIREIVREMATHLHCDTAFAIRTHSRIFEDNNAALGLANSPRITPRSKHIAVKYHFFRSHVEDGNLQVVKIDTREQKADILTKGLTRTIFETIRKLLMGW